MHAGNRTRISVQGLLVPRHRHSLFQQQPLSPTQASLTHHSIILFSPTSSLLKLVTSRTLPSPCPFLLPRPLSPFHSPPLALLLPAPPHLCFHGFSLLHLHSCRHRARAGMANSSCFLDPAGSRIRS